MPRIHRRGIHLLPWTRQGRGRRWEGDRFELCHEARQIPRPSLHRYGSWKCTLRAKPRHPLLARPRVHEDIVVEASERYRRCLAVVHSDRRIAYHVDGRVGDATVHGTAAGIGDGAAVRHGADGNGRRRIRCGILHRAKQQAPPLFGANREGPWPLGKVPRGVLGEPDLRPKWHDGKRRHRVHVGVQRESKSRGLEPKDQLVSIAPLDHGGSVEHPFPISERVGRENCCRSQLGVHAAGGCTARAAGASTARRSGAPARRHRAAAASHAGSVNVLSTGPAWPPGARRAGQLTARPSTTPSGQHQSDEEPQESDHGCHLCKHRSLV